MKINYTMTGVSQGGGGLRVLLEIINRLADREHEVTITCHDQKAPEQYPLNSKVKINYVPRTLSKRLVNRGLIEIRKILPNSNQNLYPLDMIRDLAQITPECDINVATFCFTAFSVFQSDKGIPFYHMQHHENIFFDDNVFFRKLADESYYLPLNKVANSLWLQNQVKEKYGYSVPVVNPAIDHSNFFPRKVEKEANKNKKFRVLCFARQDKWKGFPEALKAMQTVMKARDDVEFYAYGAKQPTYESTVPYTFVKFPSDEELAKLYSSADIVICPSWYESFPLYPLEAMACGTPIITTPYGTEDFAFNEDNCLIVPPKNPKVLADAILRLLGDESLRERFRKEGPITAKQFTWERTTDSFEMLFKKAVKNNLNKLEEGANYEQDEKRSSQDNELCIRFFE